MHEYDSHTIIMHNFDNKGFQKSGVCGMKNWNDMNYLTLFFSQIDEI